MAQYNRLAAFMGMAAALSMTAVPVSAAELPSASAGSAYSYTPGVFDAEASNAERHRYYRYRGYRRGPRAGDVIAGVLILGGIAAVASAASKNRRDRDYRYRDRDYRYRDRDYRDRDYDYRPRRGDSRYDGGRGIDNAVEICVDRVERDVRIENVDSVDRTGEGWRVTGSLYNGERFTCRIGADGRVSDVDYGAGFSSSSEPADGQWDDDRYEAARRNVDKDQPVRTVEADELPAYPGGPVASDEAQDGDDDRYRTAEAPDFTS